MAIAKSHFPNLLKATRADLEQLAAGVKQGSPEHIEAARKAREPELDAFEVDNTIRNSLTAIYALQADVTKVEELVAGAIDRGEIAQDGEASSLGKVAGAVRTIITTAPTSVTGVNLVSPLSGRLPFINTSLELDGGGNAPEYNSSTKALTIRGALNITGASTLTGNVTMAGTLAVTGAVTFASTLTVTGATTLSGTLAVTGTTTLEGVQIIDVTNAEALLVRKDSDGGDVFTVNTTTPGVLIAGTLNVTGALTLTVPLAVPQGGTGAATFTDGGLMLGSGTGILTVLARGTAGQMLLGSTSGDPVMGTLAGTANQISVTTGDGTLQVGFPTDVTIAGDLVVSGTGPHAMGNGTFDYVRLRLTGDFLSGGSSSFGILLLIEGTLTGVAGDTTGLFTTRIKNSGIITQTANNSMNDIASLRIDEPNITDNLTGGGAIVNASTLLITGAPTEGTSNYAILVDSGAVKFNGALEIVGNLGFFGTAPAVQAGAYTRNATIVEDRTLLASASATTINNNNVLAALIADLKSYGLIQ